MQDPADNLEVYLVGGAVRDQLLELPVGDRDWVVVGSTPEIMGELGFRPVGRGFPVFVHPHSGEEYALARTERKVGRGYRGFEFQASPDVTLEQDLLRRDFTINAIAMDPDGTVIDPWGGQRDLKDRILRHVSDAFGEDPVRVLRLARFAARFQELGFEVAPETLGLCTDMVDSGEVDALVPERIWQELQRTLAGNHASVFVNVLRQCGALAKIFPEIDVLFGVPQVEKYHPEIDTGIHIMLCLDAVDKLSSDPEVKFAVLVHDLGKGKTPREELPRHRGHEQRGLKPVRQLCERLGVPVSYRELALAVCEYHLHYHRLDELRPETVLKMLNALDGFRRPERVAQFCQCCLADQRGRTGMEDRPTDTTTRLLAMHQAALSVDGGKIAAELYPDGARDGSAGKRIRRKLDKERIRAIARVT